MRERVASAWLIAELRAEPSGIDAQQNQTGLAPIQTVRHADDLMRLGAVDESLGRQRVRFVGAAADRGVPLVAPSKVENGASCLGQSITSVGISSSFTCICNRTPRSRCPAEASERMLHLSRPAC